MFSSDELVERARANNISHLPPLLFLPSDGWVVAHHREPPHLRSKYMMQPKSTAEKEAGPPGRGSWPFLLLFFLGALFPATFFLLFFPATVFSLPLFAATYFLPPGAGVW